MSTLLAHTGLGILGYMLLDGVWLGLLMTRFYRNQLAPIARLADGALAPNWLAAFVVYLLLGCGIGFFVMPRATGLASAGGFGALFGLVVYGVYDFTNFSTLRQYPVLLTLVDVAWGTVASAACAAGVRALTR